MHLASYIIRRLLHMIPVFIMITLLVFILVRLIPGDPALTMLGDKATAAQIEAYRVKIGYYEPMWKQYFSFVKNLIQGDLGNSLRFNESVTSLLARRFPVTISLTAVIIVFVVGIGMPMGFFAGIQRDRIFDQIVRELPCLDCQHRYFGWD